MASYALEADMEILFKNMTFTAESKITTTDLASILSEKTAYIDSKIAIKYDVPVTETEMLKVLKIICKLLAGAEVLRTVKESIGMDSEEKDIVSKWEKRAEDMLDKIADGRITFPDAASGYTSNLRQTGTVDSAGEDIDPIMTMDMEF